MATLKLTGPALRALARLLLAAVWLTVSAGGAAAGGDVGAWLLVDAASGQVLARENAFRPWYPASVTKLMTTYVVLKAMRAGRIKPNSPVTMSELANSQPPSKMGFPTGTVVTMDNALKIIMVKSANDVAWAIGEAVAGSREAFVAEMNAHATNLGMRGTTFVNSNGLPAEGQVTNAHDLALLARALLVEFPERNDLYSIPALQFGKIKIPNHNDLLARFPGADGMKTGFICASGYNVVASATRGGRRLIAVVLGARTGRARSEKAAELFTKAFAGENQLGWFARPEPVTAMTVSSEADSPPADLRDVVCRRAGKDTPPEEGQEPIAAEGAAPQQSYLSPRMALGTPVKIWTGGAETPPGTKSPAPAVQPGTDKIKTAAQKPATELSQTFKMLDDGADMGDAARAPTPPPKPAAAEAKPPAKKKKKAHP